MGTGRDLDSRANANMFSSLRLCSLGPFQSAAASDDDVAAAVVAVVGKMKQMAEEQGREGKVRTAASVRWRRDGCIAVLPLTTYRVTRRTSRRCVPLRTSARSAALLYSII